MEAAAVKAVVEGLKQAVECIEREHDLGLAKTSFEGFKTLRINNLLTYDEIFQEVPLHDNVLPVVERSTGQDAPVVMERARGGPS